MSDDAADKPAREVAVRQPAVPASEMHREVMNFIGNAVADPNTDVAKLRALLDMGREVRAENAQALFAEAMFRVQSQLRPMVRSKTVKLTKDGRDLGSYDFLPAEDIDDVLRPMLEEHGLWEVFTTEPRADGAGLVGILEVGHVAGHSRKVSMPLPLDTGAGRNNLQAYGSTVSYLRRYLREMMFSIIRKGADDDGRRGGTKFIEQAQVDELRQMAERAGRQEATFLANMFGDAVRSFEEIEIGTGYLAVRGTLDGIIRQRAARKTKTEGTPAE
jgi:hypothetical protein